MREREGGKRKRKRKGEVVKTAGNLDTTGSRLDDRHLILQSHPLASDLSSLRLFLSSHSTIRSSLPPGFLSWEMESPVGLS